MIQMPHHDSLSGSRQQEERLRALELKNKALRRDLKLRKDFEDRTWETLQDQTDKLQRIKRQLQRNKGAERNFRHNDNVDSNSDSEDVLFSDVDNGFNKNNFGHAHGTRKKRNQNRHRRDSWADIGAH